MLLGAVRHYGIDRGKGRSANALIVVVFGRIGGERGGAEWNPSADYFNGGDQLGKGEAVGGRQVVRVADGRIQHIDVQVEIAEGICQWRPRQKAGKLFRYLIDWDGSNSRPLQKRRFWRIEVPSAEEKSGLGRDRLKSWHGGSQVMPAQTHRHGEAHAIQEARRGSLGRIAVAVGIEPEGGTVSGR